MKPKLCPSCKSDLVHREEIPPALRPIYGHESHYSRLIVLWDNDRDEPIAYVCPDCGEKIGPEEKK